MNRKLKILITITLIIALYIFRMSIIANAEEATFSLSDTEVTVFLNSTKYISYTNRPSRDNSYLGK